ncbi:Uncharacterised protein [Helicobacter cinaedi]|uniref:Uncharacterized protein n=1 Tax=Helicobacter cinaedi TaxID=213 RepID=A0A377JX72_9HELI|nr:hypothetical protein [Helicobacter cinaedi]STP14296.1 Uncharacterised protein [Helicobacter cinaedi]
MKERVNPRILRFNCYSFIEQNKYYSKGERLPRFYHQPLPSQLKYKGLPKFDDAPLVFVSSIKYDMGQDVLSATRIDITRYEGDMTSPEKIGDSWGFKKMFEIAQALKDLIFLKYNGWFHKNRINIYYDRFRSIPNEFGEFIFYKEKYEKAVENAKITMQERIKNYFNTYYAMLFMLGTSGEVLRSIYALKAEVSSILKGNAPSTKEIPVVDGEWYAILVAKVKKDKINNDLVSGNHSADFVDFERSQTQSLASRPKSTKNHESNATILNHSENPQEAENENLNAHKGEVFARDFKGCEALSAETSLKGCRTLVRSTSPNLQNEKQISLKSTAKTSPTRDKITLQELRKLKQSTLDLYNPPKIPLWDYYDIEIMSVTSNAKDVPSVAESAKKKFDIKDDDFVFFGINEPMLETYDFELEKTPKQWQEANTLLYSLLHIKPKRSFFEKSKNFG